MTGEADSAAKSVVTHGPDHDHGASGEPAHRWMVLVLVCAAQFMCVLDSTIVNVALPSIQRSLGFSGANLPWVLNGYLIAFGGCCCWAAGPRTFSSAAPCSAPGW